MIRYYPTLQQAQKIWQEGLDYRTQTTNYVNREDYIFHTRGVAEAAKIIAAHTKDMDPEKAYILGLLHDYGKKYDEKACGLFHGQVGFDEMNNMGYYDVAKICLTHSFPRKDFEEIHYTSYLPEWIQWAKRELSKVDYDDYDRLIQLCDMFFEATQKVDFETRFKKIIERYNLSSDVINVLREDAERNLKYFENKIGCNIYDLLNIKHL